MKPLPPARSGPPTSPIHLADRLLSLARDAETAGMIGAARQLVGLAFDVLDGDGTQRH